MGKRLGTDKDQGPGPGLDQGLDQPGDCRSYAQSSVSCRVEAVPLAGSIRMGAVTFPLAISSSFFL